MSDEWDYPSSLRIKHLEAEVERLREEMQELSAQSTRDRIALERLRAALRMAVRMLYCDDWTPEDRDAVEAALEPRGGTGA